jgi:hypothetical protein
VTDKLDETQETIKRLFSLWAHRLGLGWWHIDTIYRDDPQSIIDHFRTDENELVLAVAYADWRYGTAKIDINLPAFVGMAEDEMERAIVHELMHVLVNEMREGEIHHEERVVTGLTKAIFWTLADLDKQQ